MKVNKDEVEEKNLSDNEELEAEVVNTDINPDNEVLISKDNEIYELNNRLMRLQADFVNYRKRSEKEKENSIAYGIESLICELLPIIDNFQRAMEAEVDKEDSFYKGIGMIEQQLVSLLKTNNVEEIESIGNAFDPNYHHAVFMEESTLYESGLVIEVLQKGYKIKDKVIRPSMVKVAI